MGMISSMPSWSSQKRILSVTRLPFGTPYVGNENSPSGYRCRLTMRQSAPHSHSRDVGSRDFVVHQRIVSVVDWQVRQMSAYVFVQAVAIEKESLSRRMTIGGLQVTCLSNTHM